LIASLPEAERRKILKDLTPSQAAALLYEWRGMWARPSQIQPEGDWVHWLLLAGRGYGKTRTGAETVREWAREKLPAPIHLIAPTAADIRKVMIEGPSGLLACYPPEDHPRYEPSKGHLITWPNGNIGYAFSADEPERLRGPQCCRYWADEICAWRFAEEAWDNLMFGFRIGDELRGVITSTPKPTDHLRRLMRQPDVRITRGTTYENRGNLSPQFFAHVISKYEGTRIGRQELMAEVLSDLQGALWKQSMIDALRIRRDEVRWDLLQRVVIAIDPAVTATEGSDETGIIVAGLTVSGHALVLDDLTAVESPLGWARIAVSAYQTRRADRIVGEVNNGGDLIEANLRAVGAHVAYRSVWASKGKAVRAEPVAALYERGLVHHVGAFADLESELTTYVPGQPGQRSPNRMDALVWAMTELFHLDAEPVKDTLVFDHGYQISSI
jgi:phage terminase large subunit-like protein